MATPKLTVTTEVGTFSRRTDRPYQFIIVAGWEKAELLEDRRLASLATWRKFAASARQVIADGRDVRNREDWQVENTARRLENGEYAADLARAEKNVAALEAQGPHTEDLKQVHFDLMSWSEKLHNARARARSVETRGWYRDVRIYDLNGKRWAVR